MVYRTDNNDNNDNMRFTLIFIGFSALSNLSAFHIVGENLRRSISYGNTRSTVCLLNSSPPVAPAPVP
jgi:hypothetical protein